jgi:acetolactate synthase-1/2/3 large subunit
VHIYPDPEELGRVYRATLPVVATMPAATAALAALNPQAEPSWRARTAVAHAEFMAFTQPSVPSLSRQGVDLAEVVAYLSKNLPSDSILTNGAGNYAIWLHRYYRYRNPRTELAPTSGAMGYGLPAAIAAKIRHPDKTVVCFAGDGCFMMYPQEIATAVQNNAAIIVLISNNGMYGTIRMHQERDYPGRPIATTLGNPDFALLAQSFGAYGETVHHTDDFAAAFERARRAGRPAVLELRVDPQQITPMARLS